MSKAEVEAKRAAGLVATIEAGTAARVRVLPARRAARRRPSRSPQPDAEAEKFAALAEALRAGREGGQRPATVPHPARDRPPRRRTGRHPAGDDGPGTQRGNRVPRSTRFGQRTRARTSSPWRSTTHLAEALRSAAIRCDDVRLRRLPRARRRVGGVRPDRDEPALRPRRGHRPHPARVSRCSRPAAGWWRSAPTARASARRWARSAPRGSTCPPVRSRSRGRTSTPRSS